MAALPEGIRVVSQRVVDGRLDVLLAVDSGHGSPGLDVTLAVERTATVEGSLGAPNGSSTTASSDRGASA